MSINSFQEAGMGIPQLLHCFGSISPRSHGPSATQQMAPEVRAYAASAT